MNERKTFSLLLEDLSLEQLKIIKRWFTIWEQSKEDPILNFIKNLSLLEHNVFKHELEYYIKKGYKNDK